jgi:hypothetical protein
MLADYLSRLPATTSEPIIAAFNPFQTDLAEVQREEPFAQNILYYGKHNQWPPHLSKTEANYHADLLTKIFHDKEGILWVRLTDYKYPRRALLLPQKYQKEALCEANNSIFGGHDANLKTYMKISSSCYCQVSTKISKCTYKPASPASRGKEQRPSRLHYSHCEYQKDRIGGSMLTYSGQC